MPYMRCREENVQISWINEIAVKRENFLNEGEYFSTRDMGNRIVFFI